jgi:hypothetical protein
MEGKNRSLVLPRTVRNCGQSSEQRHGSDCLYAGRSGNRACLALTICFANLSWPLSLRTSDYDTLSIEQSYKDPITITTKTSASLAMSLLLNRFHQSGLAENTVLILSILDQSTCRTVSPIDWKLWNQGINENTLSTVVNFK